MASPGAAKASERIMAVVDSRTQGLFQSLWVCDDTPKRRYGAGVALLYRKCQLIIREGLTELGSLCLVSRDITADSVGIVRPCALGKRLEEPEVQRLKGSAPGHSLVIKGRRFWTEDRSGGHCFTCAQTR